MEGESSRLARAATDYALKRVGLRRVIALLGIAGNAWSMSCSGAATVAPDAVPQDEPIALAYDWVGLYTGQIRGEERGVPFPDLPVTFSIAFSTRETCPEAMAPDVVTAHLQITDGPDIFKRCNVPISSPTEAEFEYFDANRRHAVGLGRFSADGETANVILGRITIQEQLGANQALETVYHGTFTVQRR